MTDLRTVRNVELIKVGTWQISTGDWTVTAEHLAAAIDAHKAKVLRNPVVKIGHEDPRFDGSPALGVVDNLRLADNGATLVGDLLNVPGPVAELLPHAYPDRSVEALLDYEAADGTTWPLVLTAVSLLGATAPGIDNLASLQEMYGVAAKCVTIAASFSLLDESRSRAVVVAAARRRRIHRITTSKG